MPTYASACSGTARYSSACSCAGVTGVTSTAPTPTVTVTETECNLYGTKCNGICRDLFYDINNCGTCGNVVGNQPTCPLHETREQDLLTLSTTSALLAVNVSANASSPKTLSAEIPTPTLAPVPSNPASQRASFASAPQTLEAASVAAVSAEFSRDSIAFGIPNAREARMQSARPILSVGLTLRALDLYVWIGKSGVRI